MKSLLTAAAALLAVVTISTQAQALEFGPKFKYCDIQTSGSNTSLLVVGGSETRGTISCKGTNGKRYKSNIVIPMVGLNLGVGHCKMDLDLSIVGADLGIDLTQKNVRKILALADIGPVVPGNRSLAVTVSADLEDIGAEVGIGNVTYGRGCLQLASVRIGTMYEEAAYDKMIQERKKRQEEMQNNR